MGSHEALALFTAGLVLICISGFVLSDCLERVGEHLGMSQGLLGIVVALGANAPEISAGLTALLKGNSDLGVGVMIGSNVFNLAAILGLSALMTGQLKIARRAALLNGGVACLITLLILPMLGGVMSAGWTLACLSAVFVPYAFVASRGSEPGERGTRTLPGKPAAAASIPWNHVLILIPSLTSVVLGSVWMVQAVQVLASAWHVSHAIVGTFALATVTGIPNIIAALKLARSGRGAAVVNESFNSNNLNMLIGIALPAVVLGSTRASAAIFRETWFLLGMTGLATLLASVNGGVSRRRGAILLAAYGIFAVVFILMN